jgi:D-alanyl-D-alanine carboxypeptidase
VAADLAAMAAAARAAGRPIQVVSADRSYATQAAVFADNERRYGYAYALRRSARAGHSEHQLGTTLDITHAGGAIPWSYADWATHPTGAWMRDNAWRFGFVMSYPKGREPMTCYDYEPWHYRYVGRAMAAQVRESGLTLREWIWRRYGR